MANWKDISRKESLYIYDVNSNSYCMFCWYGVYESAVRMER